MLILCEYVKLLLYAIEIEEKDLDFLMVMSE